MIRRNRVEDKIDIGNIRGLDVLQQIGIKNQSQGKETEPSVTRTHPSTTPAPSNRSLVPSHYDLSYRGRAGRRCRLRFVSTTPTDLNTPWRNSSRDQAWPEQQGHARGSPQLGRGLNLRRSIDHVAGSAITPSLPRPYHYSRSHWLGSVSALLTDGCYTGMPRQDRRA